MKELPTTAEIAKPRAEPPPVEPADGRTAGHATVPSDGSRSATVPGRPRTDDGS
ncbi:hypothetical protein ABZ235_33995 [Streptomyces canus]|uniref:hypothetical protein n=1 Tax=Streptomyces canus TaxID=58343 RepID=UPI0033A6C99A